MRKHIAVVLLLLLAGVEAWSQPQAQSDQQRQEKKPSTQFGQQQSSQFGMPAAGPPTAEEKAAAQKITESTDLQERLALVEQFLAKWPQSGLRSDVYAAASEAYRIQRNYDKAVEYGQLALDLNPRHPSALMTVADSLAEGAVSVQPDYQEKLARAEEYCRRALEVLQEVFAKAGPRPDMPEEEYKVQQKYFEAQPHATLGYIYLRQNDYPRAIEELKVATELNQYRPDAMDFLRLGVAQFRAKQYAEAEASLQRCVEIGGPAGETAQRQLVSVRRLLQAQQQQGEEKKP
ncbi:MAG: hypothetical protein A3D93_01045 [Acidobacteria bacterium RIFCSPHIGHO2_12_FULL_67_30]|nr:MAG: hypothetical protein A2620_07475 [Acidobacteria bacterium RIFCSPHIGHO2_01_FULL_67_28]OFV84395.1 MAG: hypothetical protein A3B65_04190 [Acidobacteria bacterium RIFCSPHIGHO2_02_FULL_67_57]OFV89186.1 MAG: hypothetical protein A3D93_01045 [Acidobacteria bacterium RIFCSPHIGHO2_12_FULL_67_30]